MAPRPAPQAKPASGAEAVAAGPAHPSASDYLHSAVFKAMAAGCFRPEHRAVPLIAQIVWGGLHGVVSLHLERARFPNVKWQSTQSLLETMLDLPLHGLTSQAPHGE